MPMRGESCDHVLARDNVRALQQGQDARIARAEPPGRWTRQTQPIPAGRGVELDVVLLGGPRRDGHLGKTGQVDAPSEYALAEQS